MIRIVYFDYDNEQYHPNVPNSIDKYNCMNFFVVFLKMLILKVYHLCRKIQTIFYNKKYHINKYHKS